MDDYGFIPDVEASIHLNARRVLGDTPAREYFSEYTNKKFHDFTTGGTIPPSASSILGNGLKFIPVPRMNTNLDDIGFTLKRLERDVQLKVFFADDDLEGNNVIEPLRINSEWVPDSTPEDVKRRIESFASAIKRTHNRRKGKSNISSYQATLLQSIRENESIIITSADKNLGPVAVDTTDYIRRALDEHLLDASTYVRLSEDEAMKAIDQLELDIFRWTQKHDIMAEVLVDAKKYIRYHTTKNRADPLGYFYLNMKIHKPQMSSRPVCSDCASIVHPLGKWLDKALQPLVAMQQSYFKDSFTLKRELNELVLPPNTSLFTCDAISMYTNIDIDDSIKRIKDYISTILPVLEVDAIVEAMELVMRNNRMRFGDLIFHQIRGVAMGMSPAPTIANLYVAIYELSHILPLLDEYLFYYKRFIDDGFGIWLHDANPTIDAQNWINFQSIVNRMGLKWTFTKRSNTAIYMDMTIQIEDGLIVTSLYAKPMALYQYIPPNSCHAPGVLTGLVYGQILRIYQLCSKMDDADQELRLFHRRLVDRGYQPEVLFPIFVKGVDNATNYLSLTLVQREARKKTKVGNLDERVFFHIEYHPQNISSKTIQQLWRDIVQSPPGEKTFTQLKNYSGHRVPIQRLIVANHRAPNLANLLSYRKLSSRTGLKASSFI